MSSCDTIVPSGHPMHVLPTSLLLQPAARSLSWTLAAPTGLAMSSMIDINLCLSVAFAPKDYVTPCLLLLMP